MQSETFVTRVTSGAQKRPEARLDEDIDAILAVTQEVIEATIFLHFLLHIKTDRRECSSVSSGRLRWFGVNKHGYCGDAAPAHEALRARGAA